MEWVTRIHFSSLREYASRQRRLLSQAEGNISSGNNNDLITGFPQITKYHPKNDLFHNENRSWCWNNKCETTTDWWQIQNSLIEGVVQYCTCSNACLYLKVTRLFLLLGQLGHIWNFWYWKMVQSVTWSSWQNKRTLSMYFFDRMKKNIYKYSYESKIVLNEVNLAIYKKETVTKEFNLSSFKLQ